MQKADATEHPRAFNRVGLLPNELPGTGRAAFYLVFRGSSDLESATQIHFTDSTMLRGFNEK